MQSTANKNQRINIIIFILIILFNAEFLYLTDNKQAGIPFVREYYLFFLCVFSLHLIFIKKYYFGRKIEIFIFIFIAAWILLSSILSLIHFGQPLHFGILEERRVLHLLIFYPVFYYLCYKKINIITLEKFIVISFLLTASIGFLYSFGILMPRLSIDFQVGGSVYRDVSDIYEGLRAGRFRIGTLFLLFVFLISIFKIRAKTTQLFWYILLFFCIIYAWHVVQTRTTIMLMVTTFIIAFRKKLNMLSLFSIFILIIMALLYIFFQDFITNQSSKLEMLIIDAFDSKGPRTRLITSNIIWNALQENPLGNGALSLQWNEGFRRIYNNNFYLSDVGLLGVAYRFGVFTLFIAGIYYYVLLRAVKIAINIRIPIYRASIYMIFIAIFNIIFSNAMAFDGGLYGIILAIIYYLKYYRSDGA
jgi:hypothetical protein